MANRRPQIGNEFITGGRPRLTDLRQIDVKKQVVAPAERAIQRAATPPLKLQTDPIRLTKPAKKSAIDSFAYDLLFVAVAAIANTATGHDWLFAAYLAAALVFKVSSQRIFRSALVCLVLIPTLTIFNRQGFADTFAVFTFYFLCIGVLRALLELRNKPV